MNTFFTQFKKEAEKIRLTAREREAIRHVLLREIQGHVPVKSPVRVAPSSVLFVTPRLVSSFAFLLIIFVGGSAAYAAEGAVPGDLLYPIKVGVNERVTEALARSPEARADWHARAAERRMEEAEVLSVRGPLTTSIKAQLEERFEAHVATVEGLTVLFEEEDPIAAAEVSARIRSSIAAHGAVLSRLADSGESKESRDESVKLARVFNERAGVIARAERAPVPKTLRAEVEQAEDTHSAVQSVELATFAAPSSPQADQDAAITARLAENASTTLAEIESVFSYLKSTLDAATNVRTEAQIARIRKNIEQFQEGTEGELSNMEGIQGTFRDAVTLKAFLEAQKKFRDRTLLPVSGIGEIRLDD